MLSAAALRSPSAIAEQSETGPWSPGRQTSGAVPGELELDDDFPVSDGLYGRLNGDLAVRVGGGPEYSSAGYGLAAHAAALYYYTGGIALSYARSLEQHSPRNRLAAGLELRPLFLPRWSQDLEQGPAWLDLTIDSLSLGAGAFRDWGGPADSAASTGVEASVGIAAPLTTHAEGTWLECRGLRRWQLGSSDAGRVRWVFWVGLTWETVLETALVPETAD